MKRIELAKKIADKSGITTEAVNLVLSLAIEEIRESVNRGEPVTLRTFGTFYRHVRPLKVGRNIFKGCPVTIPPTFTPKFKPAKTWKQKLIKISTKQLKKF